jgi:hypothetical protein
MLSDAVAASRETSGAPVLVHNLYGHRSVFHSAEIR